MKVLVTGAAGQLGQALQARLATEHTLTAWAGEDLDLTRHQQVRDRIVKLAPQVIINCSGYNNVDQAQLEQETAFNINGFAVRSMARRRSADTTAVNDRAPSRRQY